jgi:NH3-dependent NAD+ synthetase
MTLTIDELLNALQNPEKVGTLENTPETWRRIGEKDNFEELGLEPSELDAFLSEWISDNPYQNI